MNNDDSLRMLDDDRPNAVQQADAGTVGWAAAVHAQQSATPDHADFYALAAEIVPTLYTLQDLANVLRRQVAGYGQGRRVYDDTRTVDPAVRLAEAAEALAGTRDALGAAHTSANAFWSAISHIGVEEAP